MSTKELLDGQCVAWLVSEGYNKTGNKFQLTYHGTKGYLHGISINAEGNQTEQSNFISEQLIFDENGNPKSNTFRIMYDTEKGVVVTPETHD
jgi:hypothetical protein